MGTGILRGSGKRDNKGVNTDTCPCGIAGGRLRGWGKPKNRAHPYWASVSQALGSQEMCP